MHRQNGFTLIELLVVIVIMGILTSVVLTRLSRARREAALQTAQCETFGNKRLRDIKDIPTVCVSYYQDAVKDQ